MGVGAPDSLINAVLSRVDMFDCVLPTRLPEMVPVWLARTSGLSKMPSLRKISRRWITTVIATSVQTTSVNYIRHLLKADETLASARPVTTILLGKPYEEGSSSYYDDNLL